MAELIGGGSVTSDVIPLWACTTLAERTAALEKQEVERITSALPEMQPHERAATFLLLYREGVITDHESINLFLQEILDGKLTTIAGGPSIPSELQDGFLESLAHLESNNYVDTYPYQRESIEDRQAKAKRFRKQYENIFTEIRTSFKTTGAG